MFSGDKSSQKKPLLGTPNEQQYASLDSDDNLNSVVVDSSNKENKQNSEQNWQKEEEVKEQQVGTDSQTKANTHLTLSEQAAALESVQQRYQAIITAPTSCSKLMTIGFFVTLASTITFSCLAASKDKDELIRELYIILACISAIFTLLSGSEVLGSYGYCRTLGNLSRRYFKQDFFDTVNAICHQSEFKQAHADALKLVTDLAPQNTNDPFAVQANLKMQSKNLNKIITENEKRRITFLSGSNKRCGKDINHFFKELGAAKKDICTRIFEFADISKQKIVKQRSPR